MALAFPVASSICGNAVAIASTSLRGLPALGPHVWSAFVIPLYVDVNATGTGFTPRNPSLYERILAMLAGQFITVTFDRPKRKRTNQQNRFWRGVYVPLIGERCGYLATEYDSVHDELCRLFLGLRPDCHPSLQIRRSSTTLSTVEFARLIDDTQVWAATTLNLLLPDPDPNWRIERAKKERHG